MLRSEVQKYAKKAGYKKDKMGLYRDKLGFVESEKDILASYEEVTKIMEKNNAE